MENNLQGCWTGGYLHCPESSPLHCQWCWRTRISARLPPGRQRTRWSRLFRGVGKSLTNDLRAASQRRWGAVAIEGHPPGVEFEGNEGWRRASPPFRRQIRGERGWRDDLPPGVEFEVNGSGGGSLPLLASNSR